MPCKPELIKRSVPGYSMAVFTLNCKTHGVEVGRYSASDMLPESFAMNMLRSKWREHEQANEEPMDMLSFSGIQQVNGCRPVIVNPILTVPCYELRCEGHGHIDSISSSYSNQTIAGRIKNAWSGHCANIHWAREAQKISPITPTGIDPSMASAQQTEAYLALLRQGIIPQPQWNKFKDLPLATQPKSAPEHTGWTATPPKEVLRPGLILNGSGPPVGRQAPDGSLYYEIASNACYTMLEGKWYLLGNGVPVPRPSTAKPAPEPSKPADRVVPKPSFKRKFG